MDIKIPSPLQSYTAGASKVNADGATLAEVLADLDKRYPGIRFRMIDEQGAIRPHIKLFVNTQQVNDTAVSLKQTDIVHIIAALSGG